MDSLRAKGSRKSLHVEFAEKSEGKEKRQRFLTAKYGSHQMSLIRKRLAVEMWVYDELHRLYGSSDDTQKLEVDIDLDELLDLENDQERKQFLQKLLVNTKGGRETVNKFIDEVMQRIKLL